MSPGRWVKNGAMNFAMDVLGVDSDAAGAGVWINQ